jgi:hypothetical protein
MNHNTCNTCTVLTAAFVVLSGILLYGCTSVVQQPQQSLQYVKGILNYSVSGCENRIYYEKDYYESDERMPQSGVLKTHWSGNILYFEHNITYSCCANITLTHNITDDRIVIAEVNTGEMCKCICSYEISGSLRDIEKKKYTIELISPYGRSREFVTDPIDVCKADEDCAPAECCHATYCVNKKYAPDCKNIMCTLECIKGTIDCGGGCSCVDNTCIARVKYA